VLKIGHPDDGPQDPLAMPSLIGQEILACGGFGATRVVDPAIDAQQADATRIANPFAVHSLS
jgi:hypothetical protein